MVSFRAPFFGWFSHWHILITIVLSALFYSLNFLDSFDFMQIFAIAIVAFAISFPVFKMVKRFFSRRIIAFDQGGVFTAGNWKFERVRRVPEMVEFIKQLHAGHTTALLSNQPPDMYDNLRRKFNLDSMFDYQFIPMHAWAEKPDPKIYHAFFKTTGRRASDIIFVDDTEANIITARQLGMKGIVFKSLPQLKEALRAYGVSA